MSAATPPGPGWPAGAADVAMWLRGLPDEEVYRVTRILGDRAGTQVAVADEGARAVLRMTREPGAGYAAVARRLGTSVGNVAKLTRRALRLEKQAGSL